MAVNILEKLSSVGMSISIDDFGTGYASLSYLQRFPLRQIKIDRSFISNLMKGSNDATIVSAIIAMGHSMGLRVVAEGVETEEQLRFLQDLQCDEMQGYLVSRPIPGEDATELLSRSSSINRMILEYGVNEVAGMGKLTSGTNSGMIGVLNEFPEKYEKPYIVK
jgi:EAL domain-containing protein (putative c-di-GMP-specific phosphodiesterase class I)